MIAIKPCGTQIYLFWYIKSHLIVIHTAINYSLIIGMVQLEDAGVHEKEFERNVVRKCN